jgi:opacity protein-like surface antigen
MGSMCRFIFPENLMLRAFRVAGLAAIVAAPALLSAQSTSDKPLSFGISGGLSQPLGDLSDAASSGFVVAGHVFFKPASIQALRFRGDVSFDKWGAKDGVSSVDASFQSIGVTANAIYDVQTSSMTRPYLIGGAGLFNYKTLVNLGPTTGSTPSSTDVGVQVGGGLTFALAGFDTFVEAKFVNVFGDGSSRTWIPVSFGVRF